MTSRKAHRVIKIARLKLFLLQVVPIQILGAHHNSCNKLLVCRYNDSTFSYYHTSLSLGSEDERQIAVQGKRSELLKFSVIVDLVLRLLESYICMTFHFCVKLITKERRYTSPITRDFHILSPMFCIVPHVSWLVAHRVTKTFCG